MYKLSTREDGERDTDVPQRDTESERDHVPPTKVDLARLSPCTGLRRPSSLAKVPESDAQCFPRLLSVLASF